MKRLLGIMSCLFVLLAGAASVQAKCERIAITSNGHYASPGAGGAHDHRPSSSHDHEHTAIHCAIDQFVPTASFSPKPNREAKRVSDSLGAEFVRWFGNSDHCPVLRDPSKPVHSSTIPFHLLLSVLRI